MHEKCVLVLCFLEKEAVARIIRVQLQLTHPQPEAMLRRWFVEDQEATDGYLWEYNLIMSSGWKTSLR